MATGRATRTDPKLWDRVKARIQRGSKGGDAGEWSARKAQLAVQAYKKAGGGYEGGKSASNHLTQWTEEEWGTKSGRKSAETGERYLPRKAREALSDEEYASTTAAKRRDTAKGRQFSRQPADLARKTASARKAAPATATRRTAAAKAGSPGKPAAPRKAPDKAPRKSAATKRPTPSNAAGRKAPARRTAAAGGSTAARRAAPAKKRPRA
ncbi:hypothetical protein SAMN02745194_00525 [Roseomonas rosea]|uniref:DUF5872 domain-containing protein n=1 Tax=Muricoccus roseus TaxID=198092 RepID=A0A1M6BYI8_9PROT|nr:hypothetical protein [Roseomonas rosea]SHI53842.1 hypothetical protein SAMN02745194_00525 [Roseomonas rosea]